MSGKTGYYDRISQLRKYHAILLAPPLLALASAAHSETGNISAAFDGGRPKTSLNTRHLGVMDI
jgi:hypothetical protein